MKVYKRIVVEQNLIGPWADAKFYATGDEMVCQFIEAAYPEVLDSNEPIEEQVRSTHATAKFESMLEISDLICTGLVAYTGSETSHIQ